MPAVDQHFAFPAAPNADRALGVFETLLVKDGLALESARHLARLATSVHQLYGEPLAVSLHEQLVEAARGHVLARMRVDVASAIPAQVAIEPVEPAFVLPHAEFEPATVAVSAGFGAHKLADRSWLEEIEVLAGAGVSPLLVTDRGRLLETTRANVFLVRDGVLATPALDGSILPGVTRAILLERARRVGISAHELPLSLEDLREADAIVLTNAVRVLQHTRLRPGSRSAETVARLRAELDP